MCGSWLWRVVSFHKVNPTSLGQANGLQVVLRLRLCSSTIIEALQGSLENDERNMLMYWYFRFYQPDTMNIDFLLVSLLRQLGSGYGEFPEDILEQVQKYPIMRRPKTDKLFEMLGAFIPTVSKDTDVFIVLDGLDEIPEDGGQTNRSDLLNFLTELAQAGYSNLHVLLVSRDEYGIRTYLYDKMGAILVTVSVKEGLNNDLGNFTRTRSKT
jgi:hypothetical protein